MKKARNNKWYDKTVVKLQNEAHCNVCGAMYFKTSEWVYYYKDKHGRRLPVCSYPCTKGIEYKRKRDALWNK